MSSLGSHPGPFFPILIFFSVYSGLSQLNLESTLHFEINITFIVEIINNKRMHRYNKYQFTNNSSSNAWVNEVGNQIISIEVC